MTPPAWTLALLLAAPALAQPTAHGPAVRVERVGVYVAAGEGGGPCTPQDPCGLTEGLALLPHRGSLYLKSGDHFTGSLRFGSARYPTKVGTWGGDRRAVLTVPTGDDGPAVQFVGAEFWNVTVSG